MTVGRSLFSRTIAEWLVVTMLCAGIAAAATAQGWLWRFDRVVYDAMLAARPAVPADEDVVIVAIDDRSLAEIGRWPWSRAVHAGLLDKLRAAGAKAVALDIILHEPAHDDPAADAALARLIADHGRVALPVTHGVGNAGMPVEVLPIAEFAAAAAALGHIQAELDPDGIARGVYLWEGAGKARHPQLALAVLRLVEPEAATFYAAPDDAGGPQWQRRDWLQIPFLGPPDTFRQISYVDVLRGTFPPSALRGAVVFVGATAAGLGDALAVPTSGTARPMPGVEINASIFSALRKGELIRSAPPAVAGGAAALLVVLMMLVMLRSGPRTSLVGATAVAAVAVSGSWVGLAGFGAWISPVGVILAGALAYPLWSWRRLEAAQHYLDAELAELAQLGGKAVDRTPPELAPVTEPDRFGGRIAVVRDAVREQRALQRSRDEMLHFLSHDLRAPLASILVLTDGGVGRGEQASDSSGTSWAEKIHRQARTALDLADNLAHLGRAETLDASGFTAQPLSALVEEAVDAVSALAQVRGIGIAVDSDEDEPAAVVGDGDLLVRAVVNLLTNAIRFSDDGGEVSVRVLTDGRTCGVEVGDNGPGIPAEIRSRLFQRYVSHAGGADRRTGGIGLGLLFVRTVAERHGGTIDVDSGAGEGSRFTLRLPAAGGASG